MNQTELHGHSRFVAELPPGVCENAEEYEGKDLVWWVVGKKDGVIYVTPEEISDWKFFKGMTPVTNIEVKRIIGDRFSRLKSIGIRDWRFSSL